MDLSDSSSSQGLVIFVESIRWLGVRWGMRSARAGLAKAGFGGEFLYWRWHSTWRGCLVLPAIMDRGLLAREAQRLADFIRRQRESNPDRPIFLMGYSCGAHVALSALELLPPRPWVESVALFAGAVDSRRDVSAALERIGGTLVNSSSVLDWLIVGLGTTLFGTGDRKHRPSAGMVGLRHGSAADSRVVHVRWRLGDARLGNFGDHFTAASSEYVARRISPHLHTSLAAANANENG